MFAGTGVGGTIAPFAIQALISRFSYRAALISVAVCFALIGGISLIWIKPRIPVPKDSSERARARRIDTGFLKRSTFYAFVGSTLFSSLGNFIPSVWIPCTSRGGEVYEKLSSDLMVFKSVRHRPGIERERRDDSDLGHER
jgi:hypothetical protein